MQGVTLWPIDFPYFWEVATDLWARGQVAKPAIVLSENDLLIYATALTYGRTLITLDKKLVRQLIALESYPRVLDPSESL